MGGGVSVHVADGIVAEVLVGRGVRGGVGELGIAVATGVAVGIAGPLPPLPHPIQTSASAIACPTRAARVLCRLIRFRIAIAVSPRLGPLAPQHSAADRDHVSPLTAAASFSDLKTPHALTQLVQRRCGSARRIARRANPASSATAKMSMNGDNAGAGAGTSSIATVSLGPINGGSKQPSVA